MRFILLLLVIVIIFWLVKRLFFQPTNNQPDESLDNPEKLTQCAYCKTHVPESTAIKVNGKTYCCKEHADLD